MPSRTVLFPALSNEMLSGDLSPVQLVKQHRERRDECLRHGVDVADIVREVFACGLSSRDHQGTSRNPEQLIEVQRGTEKQKVAVGGSLLNTAHRVSLEDAIVRQERSNSQVCQGRKSLINRGANGWTGF